MLKKLKPITLFIVIVFLCTFFTFVITRTFAEVEKQRYLATIAHMQDTRAIPVPAIHLNPTELFCLAENVYYEAGNQGYLGMIAVAYVTINRVKSASYPDNVCNVVHQSFQNRCQFSWVCQIRDRSRKNRELFEQAYNIAYNVTHTYNPLHDPTGGALFFHAKEVSPSWKNYFQMTVAIRDHIFYKPIHSK